MTTESDIQLWSWSENCPELEPTKQLKTQLTKWGQDTELGSLWLVAGFLCHTASNKTEDLVPSIFFLLNVYQKLSFLIHYFSAGSDITFSGFLYFTDG